jgi:hypothetical protein
VASFARFRNPAAAQQDLDNPDAIASAVISCWQGVMVDC